MVMMTSFNLNKSRAWDNQLKLLFLHFYKMFLKASQNSRNLLSEEKLCNRLTLIFMTLLFTYFTFTHSQSSPIIFFCLFWLRYLLKNRSKKKKFKFKYIRKIMWVDSWLLIIGTTQLKSFSAKFSSVAVR